MKEKLQIVRETPEDVSAQIEALLGEGRHVQEYLLSLLDTELEALNNIKGETPIDDALNRATLFLGARFHSAAQAGLTLLCSGRVLPAYAMSRDMIEILAILQYMQLHPKEGRAFIKARSLKGRKRFSLPNVWKTIPNGQNYRDQFDLISAMVHPSSVALGSTLRPNRGAEAKLFIGPFYQPYLTALEFQSQIICSLEAVLLLHKWYKSTKSWPMEPNELKVLIKAIIEHLTQLRSKAEKLDTELEDTLLFFRGRSLDQVETMWKKMNKDTP